MSSSSPSIDKPRVVIVTSDQHIGYANSNVNDFLNFLDYLETRLDVGTLVLLGDFVDMWRRDVSGLFLENHLAIEKLLHLRQSREIEIVFVAGNHDYHLLHLRDHNYPFKFLENYSLKANDMLSYKFKHGWEYDYAQHPIVMEALCKNLSDDLGQDRSRIYDYLRKVEDELREIIAFHKSYDSYLDHLMQPPETRLAPYVDDVVRRAYDDVGSDEILIFGHTHRPFIRSDGMVVNSGSWVSDAQISNTFVELDQGRAKLFRFASIDNIIQLA